VGVGCLTLLEDDGQEIQEAAQVAVRTTG
jgi:hypothetical protein